MSAHDGVYVICPDGSDDCWIRGRYELDGFPLLESTDGNLVVVVSSQHTAEENARMLRILADRITGS